MNTLPMTLPLTILADRIGKQFGQTRALDNVSVTFKGGEVHGVIGENGAGKSTLMKILSGVETPSAGRIVLDGQPIAFDGVVAAERAGVVMIHQELNLADELTVAENLFLGREKTRFGLIGRRQMSQDARRIMQRLDAPIEPSARVADLPLAQRQLVEIGKALARQTRVLIMDEPTAVLSRHETAALFQVIEQLRRDGAAVIYISHLLPEVLQICDRITVLRDGQRVAQLDAPAVKRATESHLAELMVGRPMGQQYPPRAASVGDVVLRVNGLSAPGRVHEASFVVHAGEIVGIAGLIGAGRTELAEAIAGLRASNASGSGASAGPEDNAGSDQTSGATITIRGVPLWPKHPREAMRAGVAYLSEDRKGTGLTLEMPITQNITLAALRRFSRGLIDRRAEAVAAAAQRDRLRIKADDLDAPVATLSGGNQQKVLLAKWLETRPKLLIVDEPTRGVDVGAREEIYRLLRELVSSGMACLLISSDLNEAIGLSDRLMVMRGGRIVATIDGAIATEQVIMRHAAGVMAIEN